MKPWLQWEDYTAGLYRSAYTADHVTDSARLLSDVEAFRETAHEMLREWPVAACQNLRHMWSGRNAWLGQASCLYAHDAPAAATREAWGTLTLDQQRDANWIATEVRHRWEGHVSETLFGP